MASNKILGIDLGTTNSAFAVMEGDEPEIIANAEGDRTTPSVVAFADDGERLVGKPAKNQAVQNPDRTIQSIKRHMGEDGYTVEIGDEEYTPEQVSAMILQKIKRDAEEYLGDDVEKAVITVPAYFNDKQRQATKDAGEIAGFEVERIVNEPTAASMAYGLDDESDQTVLVYDLGGGTFDVSVLDLGGGVYEVVATNGDNDLGGDDWDEALIDHLAKEFKNNHGIDLREDRQALQRLKTLPRRRKSNCRAKRRRRLTSRSSPRPTAARSTSNSRSPARRSRISRRISSNAPSTRPSRRSRTPTTPSRTSTRSSSSAAPPGCRRFRSRSKRSSDRSRRRTSTPTRRSRSARRFRAACSPATSTTSSCWT